MWYTSHWQTALGQSSHPSRQLSSHGQSKEVINYLGKGLEKAFKQIEATWTIWYGLIQKGLTIYALSVLPEAFADTISIIRGAINNTIN